MDKKGIKMDSVEIPVIPIGKPRMTQRDKWKKRPCVMRYRSFCDQMRIYLRHKLPIDTDNLSWIAYFPMPKSWSKTKRKELAGQLHKQKPDRDNIDKAIMDALLKEDCVVAYGYSEKRWDDGKGPRLLILWKVANK